MAPAAKSSGTRVQTWVPVELKRQLKEHADGERRSISARSGT